VLNMYQGGISLSSYKKTGERIINVYQEGVWKPHHKRNQRTSCHQSQKYHLLHQLRVALVHQRLCGERLYEAGMKMVSDNNSCCCFSYLMCG
jgi:hypothetical protein